ncbi:retinoblastoma-like protein 2 isoform X2 [Bombina bombina]|uniref:retinoblastoma-like protein 2 isoform X2 n=1 Tax=Bombina bombina TaxID=8345 RepID=UPI00235A9253|nr:retinoblastoma-like protein 2 isoform X2 [Bombina bombina]
MIKQEEEETSVGDRDLQLRCRYDDLCGSLNMDERARVEAWDIYRGTRDSYTLEGNELHWLACALYVACRKTLPTVGRGTVEGNYVSLTRILRSSELSLIEFFNKMKKWEDMANLPIDFRQKTQKLERNFTVSAVLFKKYETIFQEVFKSMQEEQPRQHRGRKQRRQPCTVSEVFRFCWVLFIHAKGNFPMISDDLVNSYHLLLCALDLMYGNALQCPNRRELLNPEFKALPEDFGSKDYKPPTEPPCIIETLCSLHYGLILEAKGIKEHFWKPYIRKLFDKKLLKGKSDTLVGFLEPANFADCVKAVNNAYEAHVLSVGSLDERIFLEDADEEIKSLGCYLIPASIMESSERAQVTSSLQQHFDRKSGRISTPLTGVTCTRESNPFTTPLSCATYRISRLLSILTGLKPAPSERLLKILRSCSRNPSQAIAGWLKEMFNIFCEHITSDGADSQSCKDLAAKYFRIAEMLYYKALESIIEQEKKRLGDVDLSMVLEQEVFHKSLLSCCLEITIFSYKPHGNFPQIIQMFDLAPYHFYKLIEVLIKAEEGLCRDVVKHLHLIEEQVLDSMAWSYDSPLWDKIKENDGKVPTCEEVIPPQHFEKPTMAESSAPLTPRRVNEIRVDASGFGKGNTTSPTSLYERYSSPAAGTACRRLFKDTESPADSRSSSQSSPHAPADAVGTAAVPGQTLVTIPMQGIDNESGRITLLVQVNMSGQTHGVSSSLQPLSAQALTGPLNTQQMQVTGQVTTVPQNPPSPDQKAKQSSASSKLKKAGSLSLFTRKVYNLASTRLRDLCQKLDIADELRKKIWTCFEYSLVHCPDLMKDRHLDQLIMCAVYVMAKVTKEDKTFTNIMKCYRTQPHAKSDVYRNVLLKRQRRHSGSSDCQTDSPTDSHKDLSSSEFTPIMRSSSTLPITPHRTSPQTTKGVTAANSDVDEKERGDLVQFYNNIYTEKIKTFAMRYSQTNSNETTPLSPYPSIRVSSPRRIQLSPSYPIYISPHSDDAGITPREKVCYFFNLSPAKRLREINSMIRTGETPTKKRGIVLDEGSDSPAKRMCPENHTALYRRLQDVANDRESR